MRGRRGPAARRRERAGEGAERRREGAEERERRKEKEREMVLTSGPHCHVESTSAKPAPKTARWSKINGFHS